MKFFFATIIATLAVTSAQFSGCSRTKFGIYANPNDCSKYVVCISGAPITISCPRGMNFDSRIGACSSFSKCKTVPDIIKEPIHEEPHHEEPIYEEPHYEEPKQEEPQTPVSFSCPRSSGRFVDPENCNRYYVCKNGESTHYKCPFKTNFSSKWAMCLSSVKCIKVKESVQEESKHEESKHEESKHEESKHEESKHEEPQTPVSFSCPRSSGRFIDPENCNRYYVCKNGESTHYKCPFKKNFSSKWGVCLSSVKCIKVKESVQEESKHEESKHEESKHEESKHEESKHEESKHKESIEEPIAVSFFCPRSNGRFADVHNCKQYFQCKDGQPKLEKCPMNLRFSRSLGLCLPGIKCVEEKVEVHEEPQLEEPHHEEPHHEEPHHEEPHQEEPHHEEPHQEEPQHEEPHHGEEPITPVKFTCKKSFGLFADREDCHKYHMCVRGRDYTIVCPVNTNYDFISKHCMSLNNARCMKKKEDVKIEEEEPIQEEKRFECPVEFGFFPSSANGKFIQCAHGVPYEMFCPASTEWNQKAQACDYIQTVA